MATKNILTIQAGWRENTQNQKMELLIEMFVLLPTEIAVVAGNRLRLLPALKATKTTIFTGFTLPLLITVRFRKVRALYCHKP